MLLKNKSLFYPTTWTSSTLIKCHFTYSHFFLANAQNNITLMVFDNVVTYANSRSMQID